MSYGSSIGIAIEYSEYYDRVEVEGEVLLLLTFFGNFCSNIGYSSKIF